MHRSTIVIPPVVAAFSFLFFCFPVIWAHNNLQFFVVLFPIGPPSATPSINIPVIVLLYYFYGYCFSASVAPLYSFPLLIVFHLPQVSAIYVDYFYGAVTWWPIENPNRIHLNTPGNMSICMQRKGNRERGSGSGREQGEFVVFIA